MCGVPQLVETTNQQKHHQKNTTSQRFPPSGSAGFSSTRSSGGPRGGMGGCAWWLLVMDLLLILFVFETLESSEVSQDSQPSPLHYHPLPSKGDPLFSQQEIRSRFCYCSRRIPALTLWLHQKEAGSRKSGASPRPPGARWIAKTM